ncbi:hypothetical protein ATEIFO6365_0009049800 [Aspergillus terreus]|uniref:Methyltransferase type 11 domain-containing protein n=1 Tax=Aspergillus terreus TaxID=33178 RepID=A0A5M3Z8H5_ASPTE|nr:hypothetical protein ATETN484_0011049300 [Aspergillus terreus]GFF19135.1 hypothetical protein ATEIFO6365_0009049800 [Aspergillus terreus]
MADSFRSCPPPRQARGTKLNPILEDVRETQYQDRTDHVDSSRPLESSSKHSLRLQTNNLPSSRTRRLFSPLSAGSVSSCSDTEWQHQMQSLDDLYDATDEESEASEECMSFTSTRPTSLTTPTTRDSMVSTTSRNRYPSLTIPSSTTWPSLHNAPKSSPVPPTPPAKIPVSPAALSILGHAVPAVHAPPSLDGSVSSDQVSNISAPATPDVQSLPDTDWNAQEVRVRAVTDDEQNPRVSNPDTDSDSQSIEIAIENPDEDWRQVLGDFPSIPGRGRSASLSIGSDIEREHTPSDRGVFLPDDALATLRHIPLDGTPDPWSETSDGDEEMWQIGTPERPRSADDATPASALSSYSFSGLSIPSPGGFFASLGPRARHTWSIPRVNSNIPPSSATAMGFYNLPFSRDEGEVVEHVVEYSEPPAEEQLTAVYAPQPPLTAIRIPPDNAFPLPEHPDSPNSPAIDAVYEVNRKNVSQDLDEQEENYESELQKKAMASLDRTSVWLAAQASYLAALCETNPVNTPDDDTARGIIDTTSEDDTAHSVSQVSRKKSVRFAETFPEAPSSHPSALASQDSIYWRGFRSVRDQSNRRDTFLHRNIRFDAVQSIRIGLIDMHKNCLLGHYALVSPDRPPYKGPFSQAPRNSVISSVLAEKAQFSMLEKEQMVLSQISQPLWAMDALKYLNGGNLIASPASRYLKPVKSMEAPGNSSRRRLRVLDLGGHASCEWAWHLAHDYPHVTVYTAYTDHQVVNRGIKGPVNHRQVHVSQLWKLPFPNNKFDVISARSLPTFLKSEIPVGENQDEYDLCIKECYRCLKPGGYLEFFMMDAEVSRAGPYASATSIEFAFNLKTRGYNPTPTKNFLCRLRKENFIDVKRAWLFMPMGTEPIKQELPRETPDPRVKSQIEGYEAVHGPVGSTSDIASISGLFGGWMWEQWLLKLQIEMGREPSKLLERISSVFDEGRKNGAGWTCLSGWARKPQRKKRSQGCQKADR